MIEEILEKLLYKSQNVHSIKKAFTTKQDPELMPGLLTQRGYSRSRRTRQYHNHPPNEISSINKARSERERERVHCDF